MLKTFRNIAVSLLWLFLPLSLLTSCSGEEYPDKRDKGYGYVQFKIYKEASYTGTKASIDYLGDVSKVMVMLRCGDLQISQTLTLGASSAESAEYGLRSAKLKLLAGNYEIIAYTLFDKLDREIYKGGESGTVEVPDGGLVVHDLLADVVARGKARFSFVKHFASGVRAATREYTFDEVSKADLVLRGPNGTRTEIRGLETEYSVHFDTSDDVEDGYQTSSLECETLTSLKAGEYSVQTCVLYDADGGLLESMQPPVAVEFTVMDNAVTDVDVPVTMNEAAAYMKDYYALRDIWESLDGPSWSYSGEDWAKGINWDFNKSPDLWGDQPGVQLHPNGRVAFVNISDFGFKGHLSPKIGQLSELVELYLGSHNDLNSFESDPTMQIGGGEAERLRRHSEYLSRIHPPSQLSEPCARALLEHGISIPEISLYENHSENEIMAMENSPVPQDIVPGKLCNGLLSLPEEIGNLAKLERLYIANGLLSELPESMARLESLVELEIYNCPQMTSCPDVLGRLPSLEVLNFSNNPQLGEGESAKLVRMLADGPSGEKIQILYLGNCNLRVLDGSAVRKMKKIGLLDLTNNGMEAITEAFGREIGPTQLLLDNNRLTSLPVDENGEFCSMDDVETFSASHNLFTEFPDIFNASSVYTMGSVDFSFNHISRFQNAGNGYKGINCTTLTLNNNPELTEYPSALAESGSWVRNLALRGCSIESFPEGSFVGRNVEALFSIDLSYNHLSSISSEMIATNTPYLYGLDISYNRFSKFPFGPLDCAYLTVLAIRGQRNARGERCLSEWPQGIYQHKGLRGLYLGSNDIGKVDDTISTLCYYLDISDNPEIIFDASDICSAYARGMFYLIYDKTQDIRNCEYIDLK